MKLLVFFWQRPGERVPNRQLFLRTISVPVVFAGNLLTSSRADPVKKLQIQNI
jgi:hypothetical protein